MSEKNESFRYTFTKRPLRIDIDPFFDLFRTLSDQEIPPSLSKIFGSDKVVIVLAETEGTEIKEGYKKLAENWMSGRRDKIKIVLDRDLTELPADSDIWIFGWSNKFRNLIDKEIGSYNSSVDNTGITIGDREIDSGKNSIVLAVKNPGNRSRVMVLLSSDRLAALPGLGRKLPHYGKYSYLAFSGEEPVNTMKGQWESEDSPLRKVFDDSFVPDHSLPRREALGTLEPLFSSSEMMKTVSFLSAPGREGRGIGSTGLDSAASYISEKFREAGLESGVEGDNYFQEWETGTGPEHKPTRMRNVIGLIPAGKAEFSNETVIIAAHYDHLGKGWPDVRMGNEGKIHPGADDNASGVAVLLELARNMGKDFMPDRNILFAAFTGEENKLMGSEYFVNNYDKFPVDRIIGVINLDTVGRLNGKKPMIIGSGSAREWKFIFMGVGYTTGIESDLITQELDASDQVSFVKKGIPGIQIFTGPHLDYHTPTDTPDKIDKEGLIKIARIAKEVAVYLSEREEPLTFTGAIHTGKDPAPVERKSGRASIGIMPDFSYSSGGVRVGMAIKTSSGVDHVLKKGDVITKIGSAEISDLKSYSAELMKYSPGQAVEVTFIRDGEEKRVTIEMRAR